MQRAYMSALYELIKKDKRVISCLSDSGTDYDELISREFPNQVINFGISENNKVAAAAGLAATGKIPFVYTTSAFIVYRSYEFLRDDICMQNRNVKLVGMGSGLAWSTLGPTHHATEDIPALRALPNLTVLSPASPKELSLSVQAAYETKGPVYIRMGMSNEKEIYTDNHEFEIGKNQTVVDGKDIIIFSTGSIISEVLTAVKILKQNGIDSKVINVNTLKPLDYDSIIFECKQQKRIYTVEEHNVIGGLGSAIADAATEKGINVKIYKIGLNDTFANGFGTHEQILKVNSLDSLSIYNIISKNYNESFL